MIIKNGQVFTMEKAGSENLDIKIKDGKIVALGKFDEEDDECYDAKGMYVYPGLIEAHCHLGMEESAIGWAGNDCNEMTAPLTPQIRGIDGCYPVDETITLARRGGVTCVASGPGSANVVGGTFFAYKTYGNCIDEMVVKEPIAMKAAFGENPKRVYQNKHIDSRMNIAAILRGILFKTREYIEKKRLAENDASKMPAFDMQLEAMIPVMEKSIPLKCHAHRSDDILTAIRIAKEFDINITLDHCTDGACIVKQIKESGFPAIVGPSFGHKTKKELENKSFETTKVLADAGVLFAITTDSPVIPQQYLSMCASFAHNAGLSEEDALKAITINPAKILGLDDRIGSIKVGKDADIIICDRNILDTACVIKQVFVDGKATLN